ncbi:MAG: hypothetical protein ACTHJ0_05195 [Flavipsychrobacter sp.]
MIKKLHIVVILVLLLIAVSLSSFGNSGSSESIDKYLVQDSALLKSQMDLDIAPTKAVSFFNKGKFPTKNKFVIRIKALNDYTGLGLPAIAPTIVFSKVLFAKHYFALYRSHISAILNDLYLLRGPPASVC